MGQKKGCIPEVGLLEDYFSREHGAYVADSETQNITRLAANSSGLEGTE
jgi:hypothetical protein